MRIIEFIMKAQAQDQEIRVITLLLSVYILYYIECNVTAFLKNRNKKNRKKNESYKNIRDKYNFDNQQAHSSPNKNIDCTVIKTKAIFFPECNHKDICCSKCNDSSICENKIECPNQKCYV